MRRTEKKKREKLQLYLYTLMEPLYAELSCIFEASLSRYNLPIFFFLRQYGRCADAQIGQKGASCGGFLVILSALIRDAIEHAQFMAGAGVWPAANSYCPPRPSDDNYASDDKL